MRLSSLSESRYTRTDPDVIKRKLEELFVASYGVAPVLYVHRGTIHGELDGNVALNEADFNSVNDYLGRRGWNMTLLQKRRDWSLLISPIAGERVYAEGGKAWHCTASANLPTIRKNGLVPKPKKNAYGANGDDAGPSAFQDLVARGLMRVDDPRIVHTSYGGYSPRLYLHTDVESAVRMACHMSGRRQTRNADPNVSVLELNLPKFIKLYLDPEDTIAGSMVYTFSHVKPAYINELVVVSRDTTEIYRSVNPLETALSVQRSGL